MGWKKFVQDFGQASVALAVSSGLRALGTRLVRAGGRAGAHRVDVTLRCEPVSCDCERPGAPEVCSCARARAERGTNDDDHEATRDYT